MCATIVEAPPTIIGDGIVKDASGLVLVVEKQPGASTAEVSKGIEDAIAALSVGLPGVSIDSSIYRPADYVADAGRNLAFAALLALALLALGSALIYRSWRPIVTVVVTAGLSLLTGWLLLWLRAAPVNLLALAGLAAGSALAVAQAASAVDGVARAPRHLSVRHRIGTAYTTLGVSVIYTAVAAVLFMVPVLLLGGRVGAFLPEVATGFLVAVAGCLVVSVFIGPGLAALLGGRDSRSTGAVPAAVTAPLSSATRRLAASPVAVIAVLAVGLAAFAALTLRVDVQTRPTFQERTLVLRTTAPEGTSPQALTTTLASLAGKLRGVDGVADVGGHVGRAVTGERIVGSNSGELWVTMTEGANRETVSSSVLAVARSVGAANPIIGTYLDGRLDALLPDADGQLVVSVYGPEPAALKKSADEVLGVVAQTSGVSGARLIDVPTEDTIQITVDLAKATELGMTPGDVRRQAATLVGGLEVGAIFEQQKVFDVQVWTAPDLRSSPDKVRQLPIDTPSGKQVALGEVASVEVAKQPTVIHRESVQRRLDIVASVSDQSVGDVVAHNLQAMHLPSEYHAEVRSEASAIDANHRKVLIYAIAAFLGILLLIQAATRNWWTAAVAAVAIPVGLVGGLAAAWVTGGVTNGALAGLAGLAVVGFFNTLTVCRSLRVGSTDPGAVATATAAGAVLPASILTFVVGIGVALLGGRAGLEELHGVAVVVAGGALTTGLVALLILPAVAVRYGGRVESLEDFSFDDEALYGHRQEVGASA